MKPRILLVAWVAAGTVLAATSPTAGEPNPLTCGLSIRGAPIMLSVVGSVRDEVKLPPGIQPAAQGIRVCKKLAAEAVAYDPFSRRLFVANQADLSLDIYAIKDIFRNREVRFPARKSIRSGFSDLARQLCGRRTMLMSGEEWWRSP
jgi:hypothetical protein